MDLLSSDLKSRSVQRQFTTENGKIIIMIAGFLNAAPSPAGPGRGRFSPRTRRFTAHGPAERNRTLSGQVSVFRNHPLQRP